MDTSPFDIVYKKKNNLKKDRKWWKIDQKLKKLNLFIAMSFQKKSIMHHFLQGSLLS